MKHYSILNIVLVFCKKKICKESLTHSPLIIVFNFTNCYDPYMTPV